MSVVSALLSPESIVTDTSEPITERHQCPEVPGMVNKASALWPPRVSGAGLAALNRPVRGRLTCARAGCQCPGRVPVSGRDSWCAALSGGDVTFAPRMGRGHISTHAPHSFRPGTSMSRFINF